MSIAGLARMSHEVDTSDEEQARGFRTGYDIAGREVQAEDCEAYVKRRGGAYAKTYEEPDTSAYKQRRVRLPDGRTVYRVVRPVFDQALDDLRRGRTADGTRVDGLLVYDVDRLTRDNRTLEDCIEVVVHYNRPIIDVTGSLDLLTDNGRTMARVLVATANKQSADTSRRVKRKAAKLQQEGIPGGGFRPFGWQDDKRSKLQREVDAIEAATKRILEGASVPAVTADWNDQGLTTPRGNPWVKQTVLHVLRNPRICGLRARTVREVDPETQRESQYLETVINAATGQPVVGLWEPIISVEDWERLMDVLGDRTIAARGHNTRKHLLSGILRCGNPACGSKLTGGSFTKDGKRLHKYMCPSVAQGGCGRLSIAGGPTDEYLTEAIIAKLELEARRRHARKALTPWPKEQDLADVREQIADLTAAWRVKEIKGARYFPMLADLEREETELERERAAWHVHTAETTGVPVTIRADWPSKTLTERRVYAQSVLVAVVVKPCGRGRRFDPDRLEEFWVED